MKELICKCGNDMFHVGTNGELTEQYVMCSKCKTIYTDKGREVKLEGLPGGKVYLVGGKEE
jgi:hypothetical protein